MKKIVICLLCLGLLLTGCGGRTEETGFVSLWLAEGDPLARPLAELAEDTGAKLPLNRELVARAACRAAVKAHDLLTIEEARELLAQLGRCRQGTLCPHGRPTMLTITRSEIERRFGRR